MQLSVIICSHNPRQDYLLRVLDSLLVQTLPRDQWELLLVDNASREPLAGRFDLNWHPHARHILEPTLGLAAARRCGIQAARADLLVFVDDDNVLAADYLAAALQIAKEHPKLGSFGGNVTLELEQQPEPWLEPLFPYLAARSRDRVCLGSTVNDYEAMPVGAGQCLRAEVARAYLAESSTITGRKGNSLVGHEDYEISFVGIRHGWQMGTFPQLTVTHLISRQRVTTSHFRRLVRETETSGYLFDHKWRGQSPESPVTLHSFLSMTKAFLLRRGADRLRYFQMLRARMRARQMLRHQL